MRLGVVLSTQLKKFLIYCHTHSDGRRYVGQTCDMRRRHGKNYFYTTQEAMAVRWMEHLRDARCGRKDRSHYFQRALRKYGESAFSSEVLEEGIETQDEANAAEMCWIAKLRSLKPNGFNLDIGGTASPRHDDTRAKMRESALKRHAAMTPKQRSDIAKKAQAFFTAAERSDAARKRVMAIPSATRKAIMAKARGALTPESRRAARLKQLASMTSEERSNNARRPWASKNAEARRQATQKARDAKRRAHEARTLEERSTLARKGWTPARRRAQSESMRARWANKRRKTNAEH